MNRYIFVQNENTVQSFFVKIDEDKIKKIKAKIDMWNGKGEIKEKQCYFLKSSFPYDKKIEVISSEYIGKSVIGCYCCTSVETISMYNYKYYEYKEHPLSKLCESILKEQDTLRLSNHIKKLFNWTTNNQEEMSYLESLINTLSFEKNAKNETVGQDLTIEEKKSVLRKILNILRNVKEEKIIAQVPKTYEEEVDKRIHELEMIYSGFYARELKGKDFEYTEEEKRKIKKNLFKTLPYGNIIEDRIK